MSRTDTWMPLYVAEYRADTAHLSGPEHGAYLLLIMHYWRTGPLPDDDALLARIAVTETGSWQQMAATIRAFFVADNGKLHHKRIDAEREKAETIAAKRAAAGAIGGKQTRSKWGSKPEANATANATANGVANGVANAAVLLQPGHRQLQSQLQSQKEEGSLRSPRASEPAGFAEWWEEYPRKDAKDAARKAYAKARKRGASAADLLTGLRLYPFSPDVQFVPHPATWLNQGRHESAHEAPLIPDRQQQPDKLAYLAQYRGMMPK